jgi:ABC-type multidrug transport system fused ATPase/permease subunit
MKLKKIIVNSLFLAIGTVLSQIIPPIFFGMKPGTGLVILFIIILFNDDYKTCMAAGIVMGILSAGTTAFPGGQIPNFIDKIITTNILFLLLKPLRTRLNNQITIILTSIIGTAISGTTFLFLALITVGLPTKLNVLLLSVVLPACFINTIVGLVLYNAINAALKITSIKEI